MKKLPHLVPGLLLAIAAATPALAQEATVESVSAKVDFFVGNLWLLIAAALHREKNSNNAARFRE